MDDMERKVIDIVEPYLDRHLYELPDLAERIVALFAPEIERLRAEIERLRTVLYHAESEFLALQRDARNYADALKFRLAATKGDDRGE